MAEKNIKAALTYLLGWLTGILFILIEKEDKLVRFHAFQSTITFVAIMVIQIILGITIVGLILTPLVMLVGLIAWLLGMWKAYNGEKYKFPFVGDMAEKYAK